MTIAAWSEVRVLTDIEHRGTQEERLPAGTVCTVVSVREGDPQPYLVRGPEYQTWRLAADEIEEA